MSVQTTVLASRRTILLTILGRHEQFIKNYQPERDSIEVETRLGKVEQLSKDLEGIQQLLEDNASTDEEVNYNAALRDDFEPRLIRLQSTLKAKYREIPRNELSQQRTSIGPLQGIKLPTIALPEFDGDYMQWLTFRDTFECLIHDNDDLPAIQKFHYLRAAVKGEAAQVIEAITISANNYALAWKMLTERYSNEYLLKKRHLQAMFGITPAKKESSSSLHQLVDEFQRHKKTLTHLGENTDAWSSILEHLLCTKLPASTLRDWEEHASTNDNTSYDALISFLQRRMRVLETLLVNKSEQSYAEPVTTTKRSNFTRTNSFATADRDNNKCHLCNATHTITKCQRFLAMNPAQRYRTALDARLCLNCLRDSHRARDCSSQYKCRLCNLAHHTLIHAQCNPGTSTTTAAPVAARDETSDSTYDTENTANTQRSFAAAVRQTPSQVLLQTALVNVIDAHGIIHPVRALLDSASQPNLMSSRLAQRLALKSENVNITLKGAGLSTRTVKKLVQATIASRMGNFELGVEFLIVDKVIADLPAHDICTRGWNIPSEFVLADPAFDKSSPIDIILGARHYASFFTSVPSHKLAPHLPTMLNSVFGWVMIGSTPPQDHAPPTDSAAACTIVCMASLEESIERFWKLEELSVSDSYSPEERRCETFYKETTQRDSSGRYIVRLPKQPDFSEKLGLSKASALRRFELLEKRLERDPQLKADYHKFMEEYLELEHMSPISTTVDDDSAYYLPHHPVFKASSTTTKVRVVFDGSAKTSSGYSLNEALCVGPIVQDELLDIILRFRTYKVALVGDIAKMYRQILLHPDDRRLVRIFFRFSPQAPIQTYELNTVTYGLSPSSLLATRTLLQLAEDEGTSYPFASRALRHNFYVDDFIGGANSLEEAVHLRQELSELLAKGGFELRKFTSNHLDVLSGLSAENIGTQSSLHFVPNETVKALGISWRPESDELCFDSNVSVSADTSTMRSILSSIAKMYDPLGLIAPIIVRAKMLMQELWLLKTGWDEPVPQHIYDKWKAIQGDWQSLAEYKTNRYVLLPESRIELHTFTDASEAACGACIYARCENAKGEVRVSLLASKSRVAPLKRITLPRLELSAAVLGAHLHHRVKNAMQIEATESFFWSDSTVTLKWIASPPSSWKTFVANRVAEVQHYSHPRQWRHVPGTTNPADLVSRGMSAANFIQDPLWHSGPQWLAHPASHWPCFNPEANDEVDLERRQVSATIVCAQTHPWFDLYSSFARLVRIIAHCVRFVRNMRLKSRTLSLMPSAAVHAAAPSDCVELAKSVLCRLAQHDAFSVEIKQLAKGEALPKQSPLRKLTPFLDEEGIIRVGGRLNLSQLPYQAKHPAVLPKHHKFTRLMAEHFHENLQHASGRLLLSQIREQYWPLDGRRLVKSIARNCFRCIRHNPTLVQQPIGQLPSSRITPSRPFAITGVDYAGPFYLKPAHRKAAATKSYLCVFVCFSTKAVHLELVGDLTTAGFLAALRRFTSRRGLPAHIYSDNGKNFEGAERELRELFELFKDEQHRNTIIAECADKGITWHFTPPKAPHFGGLWEAAVKTAKKHLYRHLGNTRLSYEGYCTVLQQIEAAMNSRPLLPLSDDPNELAALTPAHFLIGSSMYAVPEPDYTRLKSCTLDDLQKWQLLVQRFWKHWASEYLQEMQKTYSWTGSSNNKNILIGRMVILLDESLPTTRWPLARIVEIHPGKDNIVRVVTLKTAKGLVTRPITKVCILPLSTDSSECLSSC